MSEFEPINELDRIQSALDRAIEAVQPGGDPLEVFPDPKGERRADVVWGDDLSDKKKEGLRTAMAEIGPGRTYNVSADHVGLRDNDFTVLTEGGQPHKMIAQINMVREAAAQPNAYVISASPDRELKDGEREIGAQLLGVDIKDIATDELGMAEQIIRSQEGFVSSISVQSKTEQPEYAMNFIGMLDGRPVTLMAIKRVYPDGSEKYKQLSNGDKIRIVGSQNGGETVAFATSATYVPSAEVAVEKSEVDAVVLSYGTEELARVKGEDPAEPSIAQLGAEAFKTAKLLATIEQKPATRKQVERQVRSIKREIAKHQEVVDEGQAAIDGLKKRLETINPTNTHLKEVIKNDDGSETTIEPDGTQWTSRDSLGIQYSGPDDQFGYSE